MSPDSPQPSSARRAWRAMSALGCVLGAGAILLTAVLDDKTDTRQDIQATRSEKAICAVVDYSEDALKDFYDNPQPAPPGAVERLEQLAKDMRATGINCPRNEEKQ